jgi:hypothetical protein
MSDNWLTAGEVWTRYRFSAVLLHLWRTQRCPALDGKKLRAKPKPNGPHQIYWRPDIERIAAVPPARDRYEEGGVTFLDESAALALLAKLGCPCSSDALALWHDNGVSFWEGKKLQARHILTRTSGQGGFKTRWYYAEHDLKAVAAAKNAGKQQRQPDPDWLTYGEAKRQFGFGRWLLQQLTKAKHVRTASQARVLPNGRTRQVRRFHAEDLASVYRQRAACPILGEDPDWLTFAEAAKLLGVTHRSLHLWSKKECPYLPGKRTLQVMRRPVRFGRRTMMVWVCSRADVRVIIDTAPATAAYKGSDGMYLPLRVVERKHGIPYATLRYWYKRGWVRAKRIDRPGRSARGGRLWGLHEGDVIARKSGQHPDDDSQSQPAEGAAETALPRERKGRGRQVDPDKARRNREMVRAWREDRALPSEERRYPDLAALGAAFGVSHALARHVINKADRAERKKRARGQTGSVN